jgi:ABC-type branched-subunit amino acid transport system ATPase component
LLLVFLNRYHNWPDERTREYPHVALKADSWDDYGFKTQYDVTLYIDQDTRVDLGNVKIGHAVMVPRDRAAKPEWKGYSDGLPADFFSLGQDFEYYERLHKLDRDIQMQFATAMRDIPMLGIDREELEGHEVFRVSLLRFSTAMAALDAASELYNQGREERPRYQFQMEAMLTKGGLPHEVPFDFDPNSLLPGRVNVLVGANGVGKTQLMARLAVLLTRFEDKETIEQRKAAGETFEVLGTLSPRPSFKGVIAVSFSAFDDFEIPKAADVQNFKYAYCGLRGQGGDIASKSAIERRISSAVRKMDARQKNILRLALDLILPDRSGNLEKSANAIYSRLSAGQRIVLNIICDLITNIDRGTLVLFDEPETHLHPQLLATLLSVVNDILVASDSFAVIATHSPIAVQQVPASRVHVVHRIEPGVPAVSKPPIETFGANLSDIIREVFDTVESDRDYRDTLDTLLEKFDGDVGQVEKLFDRGLGLNAQIYLASRRRENEA